ncbi:MAG: hypothetical protein B6D58_00450 [candidate division Zixibacteria bacterium 4484_95]|nr:MAG: hypothetical protein B6D58_00450 [candidate division Zixibacteria bacterium 4484_95]
MVNIIDKIGYWTEIKLDILKEYVRAYSTILAAQRRPNLEHVYIDAFAGTGIHLSKTTGKLVPGSPLNAINIKPQFTNYYFIDIENIKVKVLLEISKQKPEVKVFEGDCNKILLDKVFPNVRYKNYRRGLCLLDPYGLHLDWTVIEKAGKMKSIEIFLNFPIADMHRNVLRKNPKDIDIKQKERMNRFWGDESWYDIVYVTNGNLFGYNEKIKNVNDKISEAYRKRLKKTAGFSHVPKPIPMRNSKGNIIYYLFFASPKPVAKKIVEDIFKKYKNKGL